MKDIWYHTKQTIRHTLIVLLLVVKFPCNKLDVWFEDLLEDLGYYK